MKKSILPFFISENFDQVEDADLFEERIGKVVDIGFDGIELAVLDPKLVDTAQFLEVLKNFNTEVSAIGTGKAYSIQKLSLSTNDDANREKAINRVKNHIDFSVQIDSPPVIIGSMQNCLPGEKADESIFKNLISSLGQCAEYAKGNGISIVLEALNRYETDLIRTVEKDLEIVSKIGLDNVQLLLDTFHMNIEEQDLYQSILKTDGRLGHFHIADSNRLAPGWGHLDFDPVFRALKDINYDGYISAEIFHYPDVEDSIKQTNAFLKERLS